MQSLKRPCRHMLRKRALSGSFENSAQNTVVVSRAFFTAEVNEAFMRAGEWQG